MKIQVNFVHRITVIVIIKIFAIELPSMQFLSHHFGFHNFFHMVHLLWGLHLFTARLFLSSYVVLCKVLKIRQIIVLSFLGNPYRFIVTSSRPLHYFIRLSLVTLIWYSYTTVRVWYHSYYSSTRWSLVRVL